MKEKIKEYLIKGEFDRIAELGEPGRIVRTLISLSYDKSQVIAWKSIEAIGRVVYLASEEKPEFGKEIIRRLLWSIRDEAGGIGWSSPEIIGEIVRNDPARYHDIPRILWSFMDEEFLRKGIIWAMGRIGEVAPGLVDFASPYLRLIAGNDTDIEMRFYAKWALCKMGEEFESKEPDDIKVVIYDNGELKDMFFSQLVTCKKAGRIIEEREGPFSEEDILYTDRQTLRCPFCDSPVDRPGELKNGFADVLGGRCRCGALYAYDPSGRALGEVLMDSLAILCKGDYNKAVSLEEGKDYLVKFFMYEPYMNRLSGMGGSITARRMIFVKILI